jgi:CPA1 family monovalent cation:H+ antiporter
MDVFHLFSILIVLVAAFAYINYRYIKLPAAIGLMLISLVFSLALLIIGQLDIGITESMQSWLSKFNFSELLLDSMLSFMLFAGAIHVRFEDLKQEKLSIILFSTLSVVLNTVVVGSVFFYIFPLFGFDIPYIHCLLFGSLVSPTDPIAVLSILKQAGVSKSLETKIAGESLFNDGVAVVVFLSLLHVAQSSSGEFHLNAVLLLFAKEAFGGLILGLVFGWIGYKLISSIDNYQVEVIITLAVVMGGYTLAHYTHVSGPLAMVVAGLITGNHGKTLGMSDVTADYIDKFWEIIDEILNAALFVLIGLELILVEISTTALVIGILAIIIGLLSRYLTLLIPSLLIRFKERIGHKTLVLLTWGGLRGGISVALALSLTQDLNKDLFVTVTYFVVCFSILVQGLTVGKLAKRLQ